MSAVRQRSGERWAVIVDLIEDNWQSVLDIGCRDRRLAEHLPGESEYTGLDLAPPADVIASAEDPLPFDSDAFHCVVLADVLEHLNDPHAALDEAMRVARSAVVVLLPNVLTLLLRLRILTGRLPDKYRFGPQGSLDRHRWIMNFDQAAAFTRGRAEVNGWKVTREYAYTLPWRRLSARTAYALARLISGPNVWAWEYAARLEPEG
jgi:SAM-dependent methyltransferase